MRLAFLLELFQWLAFRISGRCCAGRSKLHGRWTAALIGSGLVAFSGCGGPFGPAANAQQPEADGAYHVRPGESIQAALDCAADDANHKHVKVHSGTYRPDSPRQALIWFNARHDGITLEAVGDVTLTAANPQMADRNTDNFPAIVNHVVYFGDGVGRETVLRGFKITGANHFVTTSDDPVPIDPNVGAGRLQRGEFFYSDGGGIKIFGRSYPTIQNVEVHDNYASPCGGGVSVEHCGFIEESVVFENCIFRSNRCQVTGSAIDVLPGSAARIRNCLFVGNVSNTGEDYVSRAVGRQYKPEHGSGALTVFRGSVVDVSRCTFTGNWNGVDDNAVGNSYEDSIFWKNIRPGGICPGKRYEIDIADGSGVRHCFFHGEIEDLQETVSRRDNVFQAPDPQFDALFRPLAPEYADVGYRPNEI